MSAAELIIALRAVARRVEAVRAGGRWYLFGSALVTWERAVDIDLAVVCPDDASCRLVRAALADLVVQAPLHLTLLTEHEDDELAFVASVQTELIFPISHRLSP